MDSGMIENKWVAYGVDILQQNTVKLYEVDLNKTKLSLEAVENLALSTKEEALKNVPEGFRLGTIGFVVEPKDYTPDSGVRFHHLYEIRGIGETFEYGRYHFSTSEDDIDLTPTSSNVVLAYSSATDVTNGDQFINRWAALKTAGPELDPITLREVRKSIVRDDQHYPNTDISLYVAPGIPECAYYSYFDEPKGLTPVATLKCDSFQPENWREGFARNGKISASCLGVISQEKHEKHPEGGVSMKDFIAHERKIYETENQPSELAPTAPVLGR